MSIYHYFALVILLFELRSFFQSKRQFSECKMIEKQLNEAKSITEINEKIKNLSFYHKGLIVVEYLYWPFIVGGLVTFQWYFYLAIGILGFIKKKNAKIIMIDGFLTSTFLILIVINSTYRFFLI